jgi:hypothetical protein
MEEEKPSAPLGTVTIEYTLHRISRMASNQLAVRIEDTRGECVASIFATSFTADGGYKI